MILLPIEIWIEIMSNLDALSLRTLSQVDKILNKASQDQSLWQRLCLKDATDLRFIGGTINYKELYVLGYRNKARITRLDFITNRISRELLFDLSRLELNRPASSTRQIKTVRTVQTLPKAQSNALPTSINDTINTRITRSTSMFGYETTGTSAISNIPITDAINLPTNDSEIIPRVFSNVTEIVESPTEQFDQVFWTWDEYAEAKRTRQKYLYNWISDYVIVEQS